MKSMRVALPAVILISMAGVVHASDADSLTAEAYFAASVRNPAQAQRIIPPDPGDVAAQPDTLDNPFDFELTTGIDGAYGPWHFVVNEVYERVNAKTYWNHEAQGRFKHRYFEVGTRFRDDNASGIELVKGYVEGVVKGWVGIGITRQYDSFSYTDTSNLDLGGGAWLGRLSLANEQHTIMGVHLTIRAAFEFNPTRYTTFVYVDVRNLSRGRYALVPFVKWERIDKKDQPAKDSYQAKVRLTIQI